MNSVDLDRYYRDTFSLVRTLIIKLEAIAKRDNKALIESGYPVSDDKRTWRYYMNLNGDYHPTDEVMVINSIDTGEEIAFTKANLVNHIATKREYAKAGYWYTRLTNRYPGQTALIRGILAPIPYDETIAAKDYKILSYNQALVLWNEDQLIPKLQRHIDGVAPTLFGNDYIVTDDLMLTLMVKKLYTSVIENVHAIRLEDCYTRHTHEFFIWSHIDSFGDFSQYKASMSKEQIMWLFRNIAWIKNNAGQQYTFNKLMHNILTKGNIPLAKYDMVESTETQLDDLTPTPMYRRLNMNLQEDYGRAASFIDTATLTTKQILLAKDNSIESATYQADALEKGRTSLHSEIATKALESSMADYTNRHADTLMSVVYNEWIYLAGNNMFQGRIIVVDPKSGKQVRLPVADAYHIWRYLVLTARGDEIPDHICPVYYQNVMKMVPPSIDELRDIGGPAFIDPKLAYDIREIWDPVALFVAPDYLIQYAVSVYDKMWQHKKLYSQFYDLNKRARVKNTAKAMYDSGVVRLGQYEKYQDVLDAYHFDFSDYDATECRGFAWEIFKRITGWDTNIQPSMRTKQSDLIDIMTNLASYTIHVIKEMADGTEVIEVLNEIFIGDPRWIGKGLILDGDFKNVQANIPSNWDFLHSLDGHIKVTTPEKPVLDVGSTAVIKVPSVDRIKSVNLSDNLADYAIRFPRNDYIQVVEDWVPGWYELPPTYYGVLDGEDAPDTSPYDIPPTYYFQLGDDDDFLTSREIPPTFYGDPGKD